MVDGFSDEGEILAALHHLPRSWSVDLIHHVKALCPTVVAVLAHSILPYSRSIPVTIRSVLFVSSTRGSGTLTALPRSSAASRSFTIRPRTYSRSFASSGSVSGSAGRPRSEEHTSDLQSLMRISYAVFCFQKKNK